MQLIFFSKSLKDYSVDRLIRLGHELRLDGYDLCVRPGYLVEPDNVREKLLSVVKQLRDEDLAVPMVTGNFDLLWSDQPAAELILSAMDQADVRLLKLGYYQFAPSKDDYWAYVDRIRKSLEGWQKLGERYNVKVCYHTHSGLTMGVNCAALAHLIRGFDPRFIGAYIDPSHMWIDGEPFSLGLAMIRDYLSIVALKDSAYVGEREKEEGAYSPIFPPAGEGMVPWSSVFAELVRTGYDGPLSIHAEFKKQSHEEYLSAVKAEVLYFRQKRDIALAEVKNSP